MKRWEDFAAERPQLAETGRAMFYQFGVGGFLAELVRWVYDAGV